MAPQLRRQALRSRILLRHFCDFGSMGQEQSGLVSAEQRIENIRKMDSRMEKRFGRETSNKVVVVVRYGLSATAPDSTDLGRVGRRLGALACSGEHGTGKSALLKRLQGAPVSEVKSTSPSEHGTISKVPIQWRYDSAIQHDRATQCSTVHKVGSRVITSSWRSRT
jgi:hypothetical protein